MYCMILYASPKLGFPDALLAFQYLRRIQNGMALPAFASLIQFTLPQQV